MSEEDSITKSGHGMVSTLVGANALNSLRIGRHVRPVLHMSCDVYQQVITAGSAFDLSIEREVFDGMNVKLRPVDVETTDDLINSLHDVDAVIDRLLAAPYTGEMMNAFEDCEVIVRCGIGVDQLDVDRAAERGIYVVNVPTYCQNEVTEHAILLMLALQRNLTAYDAALKDGMWEQGGQTLGLIGYGTIARLVAEKALAFGMDVVAADPYVDTAEMEADPKQI
jgi:D-3-phosphoglycerate dehydrogenase